MTDAVKVVLDTNILVSALWSADGNPNRITHLIPEQKIIPCYCEAILLEYRSVLNRPAFKFTAEQVDELLSKLAKFGEYYDVQKSDIVLPDESDRVFYDTAKTSNAILITGNTKHYPSENFIKTPVEFLTTFVSDI